MGGPGWTAGGLHLKYLFHALRERYGSEIGLSLLSSAADTGSQDYLHSVEADEVITTTACRRWTPSWMLNDVLIRGLFSRDIVMEKALRRHRIDAVYGPVLCTNYAGIATMSWLYDFQHVHLPEMFDEAEHLARDREFLRSARLATRIVLLTEAARRDFESFARAYKDKARVLRPVSCVPPSIYGKELSHILDLYHLPERFVYIPNQFWKHKNHQLAFDAIRTLKEQGVRVFVVCTGDPSDYRHRTYFADLWRELSEWDIQDQVAYLGLIPHEHVLLLMRQSVCVLNPSLFEGWGYTVDEARSVGKQVLASDIPAHREQNPPKATFFDPRDRDDLGRKLERIWTATSPGPDPELELEARRSLPNRVHAFAEAFVSVVSEAIQDA